MMWFLGGVAAGFVLCLVMLGFLAADAEADRREDDKEGRGK